MSDSMTKEERSSRMGLVRSRVNKSTELFVEEVLTANRILGWEKHPEELPGKPRFLFSEVSTRRLCGRVLLAHVPRVRAASEVPARVLAREN